MSGSVRETFNETMYDVIKEDKDAILIVSDISHGRLKYIWSEYPNQYYNVGICENTCINMATGLSALGFHPIVHTFSSFIIDRSYEQLKLGFGYQKLGGTILGIGGAFDYPMHGCTHHSYGDYALIKTIDGSQMFFVASQLEFDVLFKQVYKNNQLNVFRLASVNHHADFKKEDIIPGKGILIKEGKDITIIATGDSLDVAMEAIKDVSADMVYIHTIKPLDKALIRKSVSKTGRCIVIDKHSIYGSVYDDILRCTTDIQCKFDAITLGDKFTHKYGTYEDHCEEMGFTSNNLKKRINNLII